MKLSELNSYIMKLGMELNLGDNYMEAYRIVKHMPVIIIVELKKNLKYKN